MKDKRVSSAEIGHRRPQRCNPTPLRNPVRRARLPRTRDAAGARPENVREIAVPSEPLTTGLHGPATATLQLISKLTTDSKNLTLALSTLSDATQPTDPSTTSTSSGHTDPSNPPLASIQLPPEIIDYVDAARNPDIYTREFVELVQRGNQDLKGKREAFAGFRDVLAREMRSAMPECRAEVDRVVAATATASGGGGGGGGDHPADGVETSQ